MNAKKLLIALVVVACGDVTPSLSVDQPPDWDHHRRRANVTVITPNNTEAELSLDEIGTDAEGRCGSVMSLPCAATGIVNKAFGPAADCSESACAVQTRLCIANTLMELAQNEDPTYALQGNIIPPQPVAARTALFERAATESREAILQAADAMRHASQGTGTSQTCLTSGADSFYGTFTMDGENFVTGEVLATSLIEGYYLMREASEEALRGSLAVADGQGSRQPSHASAETFARLAPVLSRGAVAHLIAGSADGYDPEGDYALPILAGVPFDTVKGGEAGVQSALRVLREAAPPPADVVGSLDIDDFVGTTRSSGSVLERLEDLYEQDLGTDASDVFEYFGLTQQDFIVARELLREDLRAFGRSQSTTEVQDRTVFEDAGTTRAPAFTRYAATARLPQAAPVSHWSMVARASHTPALGDVSAFMAGPLDVDWDYARTGIAAAVDSTISVVLELLVKFGDDTEAKNVTDILALLASTADEERPTRLTGAFDDATTRAAIVRVFADDPSGIALVRGLAGAQCASTGLVDGEPCDLANDFLVAGGTDKPANWSTGFDGYVEWNVEPLLDATEPDVDYPVEQHMFYGVRIRKDPSGADAPTYEVLGGIYLPPEEHVARAPSNLWADTLTANAIAPCTAEPGPNQCPGAATCAALAGQRLPLENELSDDGDAVESSWRTYLSLARVAAQEADLAGEDLIRSGLDLDIRAESAMADLEQLCGTSIDLDGFGVDIDDAHDGPCNMDGTCTPDGTVCHAGRCVIDPVDGLTIPGEDSPARSRLRECLGEDSIVPFVALGTAPVCVWVDPLNPTRVCQGDSEVRCPFKLEDVEPGAASCEAIADQSFLPGLPESLSLQTVGTYLSLFNNDDDAFVPADGAGGICDALRALRTPLSPASRLVRSLQVQGSNEFHPTRAARGARLLHIATEYNGYSHGRVGTFEFDTGSFQGGPSGIWPCAGSYPVDCAGNESILCSTITCSSAPERVAFRDRMANAIVAARALTGGYFGGVVVPKSPGVGGGDCTRAYVVDHGSNEVAVDTCSRIVQGTGDRARTFEGGFTVYNGTDLHVPVAHVAPGEFIPRYPRFWGRGFQYRRTGGVRLPYGDMGNLLYDTDRTDSEAYSMHPEDDALLNSFYALPIATPPSTLTNGAVRDALELICEANQEPLATDPANACGLPPRLEQSGDIPALESYLDCLAGEIEARAERMVLSNVPQRVVDALQGGTSAIPATGGDYGIAVARLRRALLELPSLQRSLALELRVFGESLRQLAAQLDVLGIRGELAALRRTSAVANQATECIATTAAAVGTNSLGGSLGAAAATCANSIVQTVIAIKTFAFEQAQLGAEEQIALGGFQQEFERTLESLQRVFDGLRQTAEDIDAGTAGIEQIRTAASRAVSRAMFADSDSSGRAFRVNTVMRRRYNTARARYAAKRDYALYMAYLARVALEQRLGSNLTDLDLSGPGIGSGWADSLCEFTGIDYDRIRDGSSEVEDYSHGYIGDYVSSLEAVVQHYRLQYPFSDASDTAVISLREDLGALATCAVPGPNMLLHTRSLSSADDAWQALDCDPIVDETDGGPDLVELNCVNTRLVDGPVGLVGRIGGEANGIRLTFGPYEDAANVPIVIDPDTSSARWQDTPLIETRWMQEVELEAGHRYRLSWYARTPEDGMANPIHGPTPASALSVENPERTLMTLVSVETESADARGWTRHHALLDVVDSGLHSVGVRPVLVGSVLNAQQVDLSAIMLEDVTGRVTGATPVTADFPPPRFMSTDSNLDVPGLCEDVEGEAFRAEGWQRVCETTCRFGSSSCSPEDQIARCYRELTFQITHQKIEDGEMLAAAGFARGNFNYRADSLAVSFVGSSLRDCEVSEHAESCYASGYIPYTLEHFGPYNVLSHDGSETYEAPLFTGRIVHGRGLAAERYLTNPVSSADRALVEPYLHGEMSGRPLAGSYRLRIWESPEVQFDRLEDVQLLLNYRYWTRLD